MSSSSPSRGDVWILALDPTVGSEIQKTRPVAVISSPAFDVVNTRIVVPITTWQERFERQIHKIKLEPSETNGLQHTSAADVLQIRCVDLRRFRDYLGYLDAAMVDELAAGVAVVVDYQP